MLKLLPILLSQFKDNSISGDLKLYDLSDGVSEPLTSGK